MIGANAERAAGEGGGFIVAVLAMAVLWAVVAVAGASPAWAAIFAVTKTEDTNDGACLPTDCSLREAVVAANTTPGLDMITLPEGDYALTITGANEDQSVTGDLDISEEATIDGAGAATTTVSAGGEDGIGDRVLDIVANADATISGLTMSGGSPPGDPDRSDNSFGGGIANRGAGELELVEVTVSNNTASFGGGIAIDDSDDDGGTLTLADSTVSKNTASGSASGGGIGIDGSSATIIGTTISDNTARAGGGIAIVNSNDEQTIIENSTISTNSATDLFGGGVVNSNSLTTIRSTTITDNAADPGGVWRASLLTTPRP